MKTIAALIASVLVLLIAVVALRPVRPSIEEPIITRHVVITCGAQVDTLPSIASGRSVRYVDIGAGGRIVVDVERNGFDDYTFPATCSSRFITIQKLER